MFPLIDAKYDAFYTFSVPSLCLQLNNNIPKARNWVDRSICNALEDSVNVERNQPNARLLLAHVLQGRTRHSLPKGESGSLSPAPDL